MSKFVYIAISAQQYLDAILRSPPRIFPDLVRGHGRDAEFDLLGGNYLVLTGEIPAVYFSAKNHDVLLGYEMVQMNKAARFDYAVLQEAVVTEIDQRERLSTSQLDELQEKLHREVEPRDTAFARHHLNPRAARFTGVRDIDWVENFRDVYHQEPEHFAGMRDITFQYFPLETAAKHEDAPRAEPAYFRRIAERATAA